MKPDIFAQATGIAAVLLLMPVIAALPAASAQTMQPGDTFGLDNTLSASTGGNHTMTFLGAFGASMVEGARVTGIVLNDNDEVSVTMTNTNQTGESQAVTVVAFSGTMDIMSSMLMSPSMGSMMNESSFGNSSISAIPDGMNHNGTMIGSDDDNSTNDDFDFHSGSSAFGSSMSPLGLFEHMKTGSSVVQQGWNSPENVTVKLVDNGTSAAPDNEQDTTFVFVMIVPFTEEATPQATTEG